MTHDAINMDSCIWHYTDAQGLLGILGSGALWATSPRYLNDTAEIDYGLDLAAQVIPRNIWSEYERDVRRELAGLKLHVACFSKLSDSLAQWRSYGGRGQGYAIGFARDTHFGCAAYYPYVGESEGKLAENFAPTAAFLFDVIYSPDEQARKFDVWTKETLPDYLEGRTFPLPRRSKREVEMFGVTREQVYHAWAATDLAREIARFKSPGFYEEEEVRLVWSGGSAARNDHLNFRATSRGIASYIELRPVNKIDLLPLLGVRVGPGSDQGTAVKGVTEMLTRRRFPMPLPAGVSASVIPFR